MTIEKRLGDEIVSARKSAGLTQEELAVKAGVPRCTISRVEQGKVSVSVGLLDRIAGVLGKGVVLADAEKIM